MEEDQLLKRYYYDSIDPDRARDFEKLSSEEKEMIRGMWGFAFFKASEALKKCKESCSGFFRNELKTHPNNHQSYFLNVLRK